MSPEANELLAKLCKTGKHPMNPRKAAAELIEAGLAEPGTRDGLQIRPAGRFAAWQAMQAAAEQRKEVEMRRSWTPDALAEKNRSGRKIQCGKCAAPGSCLPSRSEAACGESGMKRWRRLNAGL